MRESEREREREREYSPRGKEGRGRTKLQKKIYNSTQYPDWTPASQAYRERARQEKVRFEQGECLIRGKL